MVDYNKLLNDFEQLSEQEKNKFLDQCHIMVEIRDNKVDIKINTDAQKNKLLKKQEK